MQPSYKGDSGPRAAAGRCKKLLLLKEEEGGINKGITAARGLVMIRIIHGRTIDSARLI